MALADDKTAGQVDEILSLLDTNPWTCTQTNAGLAATVDPNFAGI
jgi:hypothetical protein